MNKKLLIIAMLVLAGCGTTISDTDSGHNYGVEDTAEYIGLQSAWDDSSLEDQVSVCLAIEEDPSIVASTAEDSNVDPDIGQAFFDDVCP